MQRRYRAATAILAALILCGAFATPARAAEPSDDVIARGKALAVAGDCAGCHTADPAKPFAGGKRIDTPFGAVFSPNLTPDRDTGIGGWSNDEFVRALRTGVSPTGAHYYPAFPYPYFTRLIRDDILAIRAYLGTQAPVSNTAPPPELRWPLNYRVLMRAWNALFFTPGILQPDQSRSAEWNRGRYLVEGLGHCGACHTPKNAFGADKRHQPFGGSMVQSMFAPRLDGATRGGLKSWSVDDIVEYLQSGRNGHSHAGPLMSEVVVNSTSKMGDADVRAIAVYLKSLPPGAPEPAVAPPSPAQMSDGERIYRGACVACHEVDGSGSPRVYPPLPGNANLQSANPASTLRIILDGAQTVTTPRAPNSGSMPAYPKLSDQEVADVATYIRNAWGNAATAVTADDVAAARKTK
ncbi:cytochrome c [Bradyrhizobium genosp. L]|uniref:c-type cytochrome n=1 Tax=Bradyrhizobium genosp. L TaxID=83637 RepID=UPI0018A32107|nr:cytochrome c [Bradyrhizobium genosp. L]QPF82368.1 cytochrome c [Bradyrhizobium genosp. L]